MFWILYNLLFPVAFLFMLPKFVSRMVKRGGYGRHFGQRLGFFDADTRARLRAHRRIWIHAVSVGEIYVALRFIQAWRERHPEAYFALSTTTSTAHAIGGRELDPRDVLFYFPVDLPAIVKKVLRIVDPVRIVLVEGELWPNLVRLASRRGLPVSLVNGRMSERSFKGYRKLRPLVADVLRSIDPICVQGELDGERMMGLGAPPAAVHAMGTVKFDVAERDPSGEQEALAVMERIHAVAGCVVLLGGSTWPGEEEALCVLYKKLRPAHPNLFLVIAPRHVERADEVVQCFVRQGLAFVRRSRIGDFGGAKRPDALFVDTTGELRNFYAVADIIFVGKSLMEHGGQNPIEPAMCGKAVVVGPNMENFPAVMPVFVKEGALLQVPDAEAFEREIARLVADRAARETLGARAARVVAQNRGVIGRTVALLDGE